MYIVYIYIHIATYGIRIQILIIDHVFVYTIYAHVITFCVQPTAHFYFMLFH